MQRGFRGREEACSRCSFLSVDLTAVWCASASVIDVLLTCVFERGGGKGGSHVFCGAQSRISDSDAYKGMSPHSGMKQPIQTLVCALFSLLLSSIISSFWGVFLSHYELKPGLHNT